MRIGIIGTGKVGGGLNVVIIYEDFITRERVKKALDYVAKEWER